MAFWKKKHEVRADSPEPKEAAAETQDSLIRALIGTDAMTKEKAMQIATVSGCVNLIANIVASLEIKLYKQNKESTLPVEDDRVYLLNIDTGDTLTPTQMWRQLIEDYYMDKGGYAYINKAGSRIKSLHYIDPGYVSCLKSHDPVFKDYDVYVNGVRYYPYRFFKLLRKTKDGCESVSVLKENELQLAIAYNSMQYENNLVKKGGNKKGFLESGRKLTKEAMDTLKDAFRRLYGNADENVVVLNDGITFKESANTSVEMQLNENKLTNAEEISKLFNVPIGMLNGKATSAEIDNFIKFCLAPLLADIETALNRDLLRENEKRSFYFAFDTRQLNRASIKERYEAYAIALENHFLQTDEVRDMENMKPIGIDWIELGLDSVLYNPKTKTVYTPNTNAATKIGGETDADRDQDRQYNEDKRLRQCGVQGQQADHDDAGEGSGAD